MVNGLETAETIEKVHHGEHKDPVARNVAVLVAMLAAALALAQMGAVAAQTEYLTQHIQAADDWNFYQAKNIRANLYTLQADALASQPNAGDPAVHQRIGELRAEAQRLDDDEKTQGRRQLAAKARASEAARDVSLHRFHLFEISVGALEIAIVLASVSVVTRVRELTFAAAVLGGGASLFALAETFNMF